MKRKNILLVIAGMFIANAMFAGPHAAIKQPVPHTAYFYPFNFITGFSPGNELLEWKLDATINNVEFYHVISTCNDKKVVLLKFVNKNSYPVDVSFKELFKTQLRTEEFPYKEKIKLTLLSGETMANGCSGNSCKECFIVPEQAIPSHKVDILRFEFKDITVKASS